MADKYICQKCSTEIKDPTCTVVKAMPMKINPNYASATLSIAESDRKAYGQYMYFHNACWIAKQKTYDVAKKFTGKEVK